MPCSIISLTPSTNRITRAICARILTRCLRRDFYGKPLILLIFLKSSAGAGANRIRDLAPRCRYLLARGSNGATVSCGSCGGCHTIRGDKMDGAWTLLEPIPAAQTEALIIQPTVE